MDDSVRDNIGRITCRDCQFFSVRADLDGEESRCKRLDHKKIKFYKPWFKSYYCGETNPQICRDFSPNGFYKYLKENWTDFDDWVGEIPENQCIALVLNDDFSIMYHVRYKDFANNTFLDADGNLKWVNRLYYKQRKKSERFPTGYELVTETPPTEDIGQNGEVAE